MTNRERRERRKMERKMRKIMQQEPQCIKTPDPLPRVSPESIGISSKVVETFIHQLEDWTQGEKHSIMMARYGKVFAEGWWSPYAPGIPHIGWSLSKTYTATAIGIAIQKGLVSLDDRVVELLAEELPKNPSDHLQALTVRHLLSMSVGMKDMSADGDGWLWRFFQTRIAHEPGSVFLYNSQASNTLAAIVQKVSGQSMNDFLKEHLYLPMGMSDDIFWTYLAGGVEWGAGGIYSRLEDNLKLGLLYLNRGQWKGQEILSQEYVDLATSKVIDTDPCRWPFGQIDDHPEVKQGYGFQIWRGSQYNSYRFYGAQGQYVLVFPDHEVVIACHLTTPPGDEEKTIIQMIYDELMPHFQEEPLPQDRQTHDKLQRVLTSRTLARPPYAPWSPAIQRINQDSYIVHGPLTLLTAFQPREYMGSDIVVSHGITAFDLKFINRHCRMSFIENDEHYFVWIALDGSWQTNYLKIETSLEKSDLDEMATHVPTEVLLSGHWVDDVTFEIRARWIETSLEKHIRFDFSRRKIRIRSKLAVGSIGAYKAQEERAWAQSAY